MGTRKKTRPGRQGDRERARRRIVEAATQLYHRQGIGTVTFGDVARKARISRPLVYFYFPDPRSLLLEAVLAATVRLGERFTRATQHTPNGLAATVAIGHAYLACHEEDPATFYLCMASGPNRPPADAGTEIEQRLTATSREVMNLLVHQVQRGQQDGSIDPKAGPPLMIALCLWSLSHGLAQFTTAQASLLHDEYHVRAGDFLAAGMALLTRAITPPRR